MLAVELRNALGKTLGLALSATLLFDHPTIDALSGFLWNEICETEPSLVKQNVSDRPTNPTVGSAILAEIAELSDAEVGLSLEPDGSERGMSDFLDQITALPPQRLALLAVKLKEQLDQARAAAETPIAVIGIGCRFPGARDPDAFWDMLKGGREGIREVPPGRWPIDEYFDPDPDAPGKISARTGGFLDAIDGFDPAFFGIAPREAVVMDPQQRLLLEVAWEALEHAGVAPAGLMGGRTGVYVGMCNSDYHQLLLGRGISSIDAYQASGNAPSVASGRLSYFMGLQGPCMTIDTSCSASLVAIHLACQSLRLGESSLALAGGVNLICAPETSIALSRSHMLAPDGRCKTFDAAADGYCRGEGCGMVVLKRLSEAQRDGDRILAVVRGSAINQDGKSSGLTAPNGPSQKSVIRDALASARLKGSDIDYVEAHGTGTSLGDPIEVQALGRVFGEGRDPATPLLVGSVKTNIGHLESAAGIAGFIKAVLSLQHGAIPKHLNFSRPNPFIDWANLPVAVAERTTPWPRERTFPARRGQRLRFQRNQCSRHCRGSAIRSRADRRSRSAAALSGGLGAKRDVA